MDRNEWLEAYAHMPEVDRKLIRAEIIRGGHFQEAPGLGCAMATCIEIMEQVKAGREPLEACRHMLDEMAGMTCD